MHESTFICSRCGHRIEHSGDPLVVAALEELYRNAEFAICRDCMTKEEKERALAVVVQKLVEYYASQGLVASIKTDLPGGIAGDKRSGA